MESVLKKARSIVPEIHGCIGNNWREWGKRKGYHIRSEANDVVCLPTPVEDKCFCGHTYMCVKIFCHITLSHFKFRFSRVYKKTIDISCKCKKSSKSKANWLTEFVMTKGLNIVVIKRELWTGNICITWIWHNKCVDANKLS